MPSPHEPSGLRDARLHQALLHAPDADTCPPDSIRAAILQAAQKTHTRRATEKPVRFWHIFVKKTGSRTGFAWQGSAFTAAAIAILTMSMLLWQQPASHPSLPADIAMAPMAQAPEPATVFSATGEESAVTLPPHSAVLAQGKIASKKRPSYSELSAPQSARSENRIDSAEDTPASHQEDAAPSTAATEEYRSQEFADAAPAIMPPKEDKVQNTPLAAITAAPAGNRLTDWTRLYLQNRPQHAILRTQATTLAELLTQLTPSGSDYSKTDKNFVPDYTLVLMHEDETLGTLQIGTDHWRFTPAQDAVSVQSGPLSDNLRSQLYTTLQHSLAQPAQPERR